MRTSAGPILTNIQGVVVLLFFLAIMLCYAMVWFKLSAVSKASSSGMTRTKYHGTARVMMLFVAAFLFQYWPMMLYGAWALFAMPHVSIVILLVLFVNMGGFFNFLAYTVIRRKYQKTGPAGASHGDSTTVSSVPK